MKEMHECDSRPKITCPKTQQVKAKAKPKCKLAKSAVRMVGGRVCRQGGRREVVVAGKGGSGVVVGREGRHAGTVAVVKWGARRRNAQVCGVWWYAWGRCVVVCVQ